MSLFRLTDSYICQIAVCHSRNQSSDNKMLMFPYSVRFPVKAGCNSSPGKQSGSNVFLNQLMDVEISNSYVLRCKGGVSLPFPQC